MMTLLFGSQVSSKNNNLSTITYQWISHIYTYIHTIVLLILKIIFLATLLILGIFKLWNHIKPEYWDF